MNGRCMRCKKEVEIQDPHEVTLRNGRVAYQGLCPNCSTKVSRFAKIKK